MKKVSSMFKKDKRINDVQGLKYKWKRFKNK